MTASILSTGCSTLGLSLYPTGMTLTEQTEAVLAATPRHPLGVPRERDKAVLPTHFLQPGDVLLVEMVSLDSDIRIPADQRVLADGTLDLGGYGRIVVAGGTLESTEDLIERTIATAVAEDDDVDPEDIEVNVRLIEPVHRYYVLGEVNSPGAFTLTGYETVLDGILEAGGLTTSASTCRILLSRPTDPCSCRVTLPICYREITQLGDTTTNYQLRPGDRIVVASRSCCEEWMFWKAGETCERCCACQTACPDPASVGPSNPMPAVTAMAVLESLHGRIAESLPAIGDAAGSGASDGSGLEPTVVTPLTPNADNGDGPVDAGNAGLGSGELFGDSVDQAPFPELIRPLGSDGGTIDRGSIQPELMDTVPVPRRPGKGGVETEGGLDGELEFSPSPRSSSRFSPMWLR